MRKSKILVFCRLIISSGLISYLVFLVDWRKTFLIIKNLDKIYFIIAFLLCFWGIFFGALRWHLIFKENKINFSILQAYKGYLSGNFYNIFLPGIIGGDFIRIGISCFETRCELSIATGVVFLERLLGVISLFFFLFFSYFFLLKRLSFTLFFKRILLAISFLLFIFILLILIIHFKSIKNSKNKIFCFIDRILKAFFSLRWKVLVFVLALSTLFQGVDIFVSFLLAKAININLSLIVFWGVMPLVYFLTILPISIGGLGVREGSLAFLLSKFEVPLTEGITFSFLIYLNKIFVGIVGGLFEVREYFRRRKNGKT
ncbi:MAG: lysylphosphatidylglycerol synthase transmembrane domain-containing protein [candidate division WOR-3 bacterium]